jgi:hypothetical protein
VSTGPETRWRIEKCMGTLTDEVRGLEDHSRCFNCVAGPKEAVGECDGSSIDDITTYYPACIVTYPVLLNSYCRVSCFTANRASYSFYDCAHRKYNLAPSGARVWPLSHLDVRGQGSLSRPTTILLRRLFIRSLIALRRVSLGLSSGLSLLAGQAPV